MDHLFTPYELAVIAKLKGFNEPCFKFFGDTKLFKHEGKFDYSNDLNKERSGIKEFVLAPLYQQIIDWLKTQHQVVIRPALDLKSWELLKFEYNNGEPLFYNKLDEAIGDAFTLIYHRHVL